MSKKVMGVTISVERDAFMLFKFQLGQIVRHRATGERGIVTNRVLVQAQTGNTGHGYYVGSMSSRQVLEIELEAVEGEA